MSQASAHRLADASYESFAFLLLLFVSATVEIYIYIGFLGQWYESQQWSNAQAF